MAIVAGVLGRAGQKGKARRLQDSAAGSVSWNTPAELTRHMRKEVAAAVVKRKEVMGRMQSNVQGFNEEEQKLLRIQNQEVDVEVSEDDMVSMLGEAAAPSGGETGAAERLAGVEEQLQAAQQQAKHIELAVTGGRAL